MAAVDMQRADRHNATNQITIHNIVIICKRDAMEKDKEMAQHFVFIFFFWYCISSHANYEQSVRT